MLFHVQVRYSVSPTCSVVEQMPGVSSDGLAAVIDKFVTNPDYQVRSVKIRLENEEEVRYGFR